jgi:RNA polymerase sporulation-specific sigma factor
VTDEQLAVAAQRGDRHAGNVLAGRYLGLCYHVVRDLYLPGADRDDVRQEALVGLTRAISDYRPDGGSFRNFATLCARRHAITALTLANRKKHQLLSVSDRWQPLEEDGSLPGGSAPEPPDPRSDVAAQVQARAELAAVLGAFGDGTLTDAERTCFAGFAVGATYAEIETLTGRDAKFVDNSYQRARRKLASRRAA